MGYFTREELQCKCGCKQMKLSSQFIDKLDKLRESVGFPLTVTSGYRCPEHNAKVSSTGRTGPHTREACDFGVSGSKAYAVLSAALQLGFKGIGVAQKGPVGSRFIHVDDLPNDATTPRPYVWSY